MKKRTSILISAILLLALCLSACGTTSTDTPATSAPATAAPATAAPGNESAPSAENENAADDYEPFTIRIATAKPDKNNQTIYAREIAAYLEEKTGGKVTAEVYANATLLSEDAMLDGMRGHVTDIGILSAANFSGYVPEVAVYSLIGIFGSEENQIAAFEPEDGILAYVNGMVDEKLGLHTMGFLADGGTDCLGNMKRPITQPSDAAGMTFRAPNNEIALAISAFGGSPMTLPSSDAYSALQNGVCNGVFVSSSSFINNRFVDIVPYVTNLPGTPLNYVSVMVSEDTWESWPESVRTLLTEKCEDIYAETKADAKDADVREWATIGESCEVVHLTDEQIEAFIEIIRPAQLETLKEEIGEESYGKIMDILEKYAF